MSTARPIKSLQTLRIKTVLMAMAGVITVGLTSIGAVLPAFAQRGDAPRVSLSDIPAAKVDANIVYGTFSGLALIMDIYHPAQPNGYGVVFVHGGHWRASPSVDTLPWKNGGNVAQIVAFVTPLLKAGYTVFVPDYRVAPHFQYPVPVQDVQRAIRYVRFNAKRFGIDPDHMGGVGFSAGAHLVSMAALLDGKPTNDDMSAVGQVSARLQAVVSGSTPANLVENAKSVESDAFTSGFIGDLVTPNIAPNSDLYKRLMAASPVTYVSASAPPFLLFHAEQDTEVPIKIEEEFQQAFEKAGVPVKLIRVPNSDHESTFLGEHGAMFTPAMVQWFDQYLKLGAKSK